MKIQEARVHTSSILEETHDDIYCSDRKMVSDGDEDCDVGYDGTPYWIFHPRGVNGDPIGRDWRDK